MKKQIIILDDTVQFQTSHKRRLLENVPGLAENFDVPDISPTDFEAGLKILHNRYKNGGLGADESTFFDEAAVLIVDYRLVDLSLSFITGEEVAYFARSYSNCGVIVGVNQFGARTFDLTLCGHPESFADVNISEADIENLGLWSREYENFRPFHWPVLPDAAISFEERVAEINDFNQELFEFIGFGEEIVQMLPRSVLECVTKHRKASQVLKTTFNDFLYSGFCLKGKDDTSDAYKKRIIASRLYKWIDRLILGGQNTLVDAPHLVSRFPSLFSGENSVEGLNRLAGLNPPIKSEILDAYRFKRSNWTQRPAWFWESLKSDEGIAEVSNPWERKEFPYVFCEDSSSFHRDGVEFVASLPSPFTRRFVKRFPDIEYMPELRFAL